MLNETPRRIPTIGFVSLGCAKALVDSERVITELRSEGYSIVDNYRDSDLVIVNTCGFINEAIEESLGAIAEATRENGRVIVMGCLGGKKDADGTNFVMKRNPAVLGVLGPEEEKDVVKLVHQHLPAPHAPYLDLVPGGGVRLTPQHYAYLKISEGCNNHCTFCIIPQLRGKLHSRSMDSIMREAWSLKEDGVKEIMVIAEDTSAYGSDLGYKLAFAGGRPVHTRLEDLCVELGRLGLWIRLHYVYPYPMVDRIIPLMAEGKILPYLDIPLQHADPDVLRRMARPARRRLSGSASGARSARISRSVRPSWSVSRGRPRRSSSTSSTLSARRSLTVSAASRIRRLTARRQTTSRTLCRMT